MREDDLHCHVRIGGSFLRAGAAFNLDRDYGLVIERFCPAGVGGHGLKYCLYDFAGGAVPIGGDDLLHSLASEKLACGIACIEYTVAEKDEQIPRLGFERELVVLDFIEQPEGQACGFDNLYLPLSTTDRSGQAGVSHLQGAAVIVPNGVDQGHELSLDTTLAEGKVHGRKHLRRTGLDGSMRPQYAADQRRVNGGRSSLAAHIADDNGAARKRVLKKVVEIAPYGPCWNKFGCDLQI